MGTGASQCAVLCTVCGRERAHPGYSKRMFKRASHGLPRTGSGVEEVVGTYISCQAVKQHLITEDHEGLVNALTELCERRGWELNVIAMEQISKEEQLAMAARTTVSTVPSVTSDLFTLFVDHSFFCQFLVGSRAKVLFSRMNATPNTQNTGNAGRSSRPQLRMDCTTRSGCRRMRTT